MGFWEGEGMVGRQLSVMLSFGVVNLWKLEQQDLGEHYRWANNDNIRRLIGGAPTPRSFADLEGWFKTLQTDPTQQVFSTKTTAAEHVGWVQLSDIKVHYGSADVGVVVDEAHWGNGYGHDSLVAVIRYAFEDMRLHRLSAQILAINTPSLKLFEKLGFRREGVLKEACFTSGRYLDVMQLGLLSREFEFPQPKSSEGPSHVAE